MKKILWLLILSLSMEADVFERNEKGCELNDKYSCRNLASMYENGEDGVKKDYAKAVEYYEKACTLGTACYSLSRLYKYGYGVKKDAIKAKKYAELDKEQRDEVKMEKLYSKLCQDGKAYACYNLGDIYMNVRANSLKEVYALYAKSVKKALPFYEKSCTADFVLGCKKLGDKYVEGKGVEQNWEKAFKYYSKACDKKYDDACFSVGELYRKGDGVKKSEAKSIEYYEKACYFDHSTACRNLGDIYRDGIGVKKNKKRATELYTQACSAGSRQGCRDRDALEGKAQEKNGSLKDMFSMIAHESGTWEDDPKNWNRVFGRGHTDALKEIHSYYWRSAHFTMEFEYFFELEVIEKGYNDWIHNLEQMKAEVKKEGKECVSVLSKGFNNKPSWFIADDKEDYRCFSNQGVKVFFNEKTKRIYMTDSQI